MLEENLRLLEPLAAEGMASDIKALQTALNICEDGPARSLARSCKSCQASFEKVSFTCSCMPPLLHGNEHLALVSRSVRG